MGEGRVSMTKLDRKDEGKVEGRMPDGERFQLPYTLPALAFDWDSQVVQYPEAGEPGISYFHGEVPETKGVDCLLYRGDDGKVIGILNHFPEDIPNPYYDTPMGRMLGASRYIERAGNYTVMVDPAHRRKGIGMALTREGVKRFGLDLLAQTNTREGAELDRAYLERYGREDIRQKG